MAFDLWPIENGRSTVGSTLRELAAGASSIDIASAFVTSRGLDTLLPSLRRVARAGRVRIVTGVKDFFTEPSALRSLLQVAHERGSPFSVRISVDPRFHWKAYFVEAGPTATVIIGSSNATADGLDASGELNLATSMPSKSATYTTLHRPFEKTWQTSKPLTTDWLAAYTELHGRYKPKPRPAPAGDIKTLLKLGTTKRPAASTVRRERFGLVYTTGDFSRETNDLLAESTNWDEQGWTSLAVWPSLDAGHRVIYFDMVSKWVILAEVRDVESTRRTVDGNYFAALSQIAGTSKRHLTPQMWTKLKQTGVIARRDDAWSNRFIKRSIWHALQPLFAR